MEFDHRNPYNGFLQSLCRENRTRLTEALQDHKSSGLVVLQGGNIETKFSTDRELPFHQESYFHWAFGVNKAGYFGIIDLSRNGHSILCIPKLDSESSVEAGYYVPGKEANSYYKVDETKFVGDLGSLAEGKVVLVMGGMNTDSRLTNQPADIQNLGLKHTSVNNAILFPVISALRIEKTAKELHIMHYVNEAAAEAHKAVMLAVKPGIMEYELEAVFRYQSALRGCREVSFLPIAACGENCAVLHYNANDKCIGKHQSIVADMGCECAGYAADITCTYPASGRFSKWQKTIYELVLKANREVIKTLRPGIEWVQMHHMSNKILLAGLTDAGILKGKVEELMSRNIGGYFMPHGLGHLIGVDVHDVGGYNPGEERFTDYGVCRLRTNKVLRPGMCITVEPGCYFNQHWMNLLKASKQLTSVVDWPVLEECRKEVAGVRVEDTVAITDNGCEILTKGLPRTAEEIEKFMKDGSF